MRLFLLLLFLSLPALAALGHDMYLAFGKELDYTKPLRLSNIGWLWKIYSLETYEWANANIDKETWKSFVAPVLLTKSVVAGLIPVAIAAVIAFMLKLFGLGPYQASGWLLNRAPRQSFSYKKAPGEKAKGPLKYSRK